MGLLDSLVGGALNNLGGNQEQGGFNLNPAMLMAAAPLVLKLLGNDGQQGGLNGLVAKFQEAGLGDAVQSWIGSGTNQAISGEQLSSVLGSDFVSQLAQKTGMANSEAAGGLAQMLPQLINTLTPNGQAPAAGLGNADEIMGQLGGLLGGAGGQGGGLGNMLGGLAGAFLKK
ncbi:MAG: YidB family protein [Brachymonas sp.]|jgi:uncharacterized protein YidB (DUF937 family)